MQFRAISPLASVTEVKISTLNEYGGALGVANYALDRHMSFTLFESHLGAR